MHATIGKPGDDVHHGRVSRGADVGGPEAQRDALGFASSRRRRWLALLLLVVTACSGPARTAGTQAPTTHVSVGAAGADWPTYHRVGSRSGYSPDAHSVEGLGVAWRSHLDGAVYGQPLVVGDRVLVATENDTLYGLNRRTGAIEWKRHVGTPVPLSALPCGDIDPLGITGTPVYDPSTERVFAVAETTGYQHVLVGVDAATGTVEVRRDIPVPDGHPRYDQQRPALALAHHRVYVAFGGLFGDCGSYIGSVVGVPTSGHGTIVSYRVPAANNAAIWAAGGPVVDEHGNLYVSVGNGAATNRRAGYDGSDSVVELSPNLRRLAYFAPRSWPEDNADDLDLGSMTPALTGRGEILIAGKRGIGYLLAADDLGGIGGELAQEPLCRAFGGPAHHGSMVYLPCTDGGPAAVDVSHRQIHVRWHGPAGANGSPVIGGGAVWVTDWNTGVLYALDPKTGHSEHHIDIADSLPHFASPTLSGNLVLLGTTDGVVAVATSSG